jgi:hypothetical protein
LHDSQAPPREQRFSWSGNRAVLVYDKDDPDDNALQLAYAWARWICCRELTADGAALDVGRIEAALTRGRQALARQQAARSCFTAATKKIDEGAGHVTALVDEVRSALTELWDELKSRAPGGTHEDRTEPSSTFTGSCPGAGTWSYPRVTSPLVRSSLTAPRHDRALSTRTSRGEEESTALSVERTNPDPTEQPQAKIVSSDTSGPNCENLR